VFVAHRQGELAIQRLEEEIKLFPDASVTPWLILLDLLHRENSPERHAAVRLQCRQYFNIALPIYGETTPSGKPGLESYPHIIAMLIRVWPRQEAVAYLDSLLRDTRGGTRVGFDLSAFLEINFLQDLRAKIPDASVPDFPEIRGIRF
jgi:pilus assembly protein FimV